MELQANMPDVNLQDDQRLAIHIKWSSIWKYNSASITLDTRYFFTPFVQILSLKKNIYSYSYFLGSPKFAS